MSTYADELLKDFAAARAAHGTSVTIQDGKATIDVVAVGPVVSLETAMAGLIERGTFNFECRRSDAEAAGLTEDSRLSVAESAVLYQVQPIEDDPGCPLLYVSTTRVQS